MISLFLTASRFGTSEYADTLGQIQLSPVAQNEHGAWQFDYCGDLDGALSQAATLSGFFGEVADDLGRCNFSFSVGERRLLDVGGFFTKVPLAVEVYDITSNIWFAIHVSLDVKRKSDVRPDMPSGLSGPSSNWS